MFYVYGIATNFLNVEDILYHIGYKFIKFSNKMKFNGSQTMNMQQPKYVYLPTSSIHVNQKAF